MPGIITAEDWQRIDAVHGYMTEHECQWLASLASVSRSWTEIGVLNGRSALAVGLHLSQEAWLQLVDTGFQPEFWQVREYLRKRRPDLRIIVAECTSEIAARHLPSTDTVFVDGDHRKDFVITDLQKWRYKCNDLCGHDYDNPPEHSGVVAAVDEVLGKVEHPVGAIWWTRRWESGPS